MDTGDAPGIIEADHVRSFEIRRLEQPERDLLTPFHGAEERAVAILRFPDRVGPSHQDDLLRRETGDALCEGLARGRRIAEHDRRAQLLRVRDHVFLLRSRDDAKLGAAGTPHPSDDVVHDGPALYREHLFRAGEGLKTGGVTGGGNDTTIAI